MRHTILTSLALVAACGLLVEAASAKVLDKTTHGRPAFGSIEVLAFAPEGVLLIGDGRNSQVFAVATGDTIMAKVSKPFATKVEGLGQKLGETLGTDSDGLEILDMAVNPASGKAYFAVKKKDDNAHAVLTVDGTGKIGELAMESVDYARLALDTGSGAKINRVTDIAWADDRAIVAGAANEEFASKIFVIRGPLSHEIKGLVHSAETYHVAHHKWETKAPMSAIIPYKEDDKTYVVGAFACTPVVKYSLDDLQPDAKVKGVSVVELGSGNKPLDMFAYEKDGREYVLANTFRFHHAKAPVGPSPYWTVRFERDLLGEKENVNEKATWRIDKERKPITDRIVFIDAYNGVTQMDQLDAGRALVVRMNAAGGVDLEALPLP